jgi:hypothetical protein
MSDVTVAVGGGRSGASRRSLRSDHAFKWLLRILLPLSIGLGALAFYWAYLADAECFLACDLFGAVPLTITCAAVALWAWDVWQPNK